MKIQEAQECTIATVCSSNCRTMKGQMSSIKLWHNWGCQYLWCDQHDLKKTYSLWPTDKSLQSPLETCCGTAPRSSEFPDLQCGTVEEKFISFQYLKSGDQGVCYMSDWLRSESLGFFTDYIQQVFYLPNLWLSFWHEMLPVLKSEGCF